MREQITSDRHLPRPTMRAPPSSDPNNPGSLGPVLDFMRRLWAVDHALHSLSKRMETRMGLTGPQRLVVRIVGRFPGINAGQLAGILHVHPSTLTGVLARLEDRGLVTRRADPTDLRRALFTLTARGRGLDQPRSGTVEAALESTLAALPERNIRIAEQVLAQIADALALDLPLQARNGKTTSRGAPRAAAKVVVKKKRPATPAVAPARAPRTRVVAGRVTPTASPATAPTRAPRTRAVAGRVTPTAAPAVAPVRSPRTRGSSARVTPTTRVAREAARKGS